MRKNIRQDEVFPIRSIPDGNNVRRNHIVIECSGCDNEESMPNNTQAGAPGIQLITRRFTRLGWYVGSTPGSHLCPTCNPKRQDRTVLTIVPKAETEELKTVSKSEMTFADRRIINAKLEEVYENDLVGYRAGWTDVRVASDLGTDTSWVAELRATNFGPAEGNALVTELKREQAELIGRLEQLQAEGTKLVQAVKALGERIDGITR